MAKETAKNEVFENENETEKQTILPSAASDPEAASAASHSSPIDPFASRRKFEEENEGIDSDGNLKFFRDTGTFLYKFNRRDMKKDIIYTDLRFAYEVEVNGYVSQILVNIKPVASGIGIYEVINSIYNGAEYLPVIIVRSESVDRVTNRKAYSYSLQLSAKNSAGIPIDVVLTPSERSDRVLFNTYIEILKANGVID